LTETFKSVLIYL